MIGLFRIIDKCIIDTYGEISAWDVSNVTNMENLFQKTELHLMMI